MGVRPGQRVSGTRIARLLRSLLDASTLCAIATVTPRGSAYVNTAYFAWDDDFRLVWLSDAGATHSGNLRSMPSAAIAVFDSSQTWGGADRGVQLFGSAAEAGDRAMEDAHRLYTKRFPEAWDLDRIPYRFYVFRPRRVKLFDERELGAGVFVTATVGRGGDVAWERTEKVGDA